MNLNAMERVSIEEAEPAFESWQNQIQNGRDTDSESDDEHDDAR